MTDRNRTKNESTVSRTGHYTESTVSRTGRYTEADRTRSAQIEEQFRVIRNEEVHRASNSGRLRTVVRKIGFQPNPN